MSHEQKKNQLGGPERLFENFVCSFTFSFIQSSGHSGAFVEGFGCLKKRCHLISKFLEKCWFSKIFNFWLCGALYSGVWNPRNSAVPQVGRYLSSFIWLSARDINEQVNLFVVRLEAVNSFCNLHSNNYLVYGR